MFFPTKVFFFLSYRLFSPARTAAARTGLLRRHDGVAAPPAPRPFEVPEIPASRLVVGERVREISNPDGRVYSRPRFPKDASSLKRSRLSAPTAATTTTTSSSALHNRRCCVGPAASGSCFFFQECLKKKKL